MALILPPPPQPAACTCLFSSQGRILTTWLSSLSFSRGLHTTAKKNCMKITSQCFINTMPYIPVFQPSFFHPLLFYSVSCLYRDTLQHYLVLIQWTTPGKEKELTFTECPQCTSASCQGFHLELWLVLHYNPRGRNHYDLQFRDGKKEVTRGQVTCPRSHS